MNLRIFWFPIAISLIIGSAAHADMAATLLEPWNGETVPDGQQCTLYGGNGATPPLQITGIPAGTAYLRVEFNDEDFEPLSTDGGHGIIAYRVSGQDALLPAVPGLQDDLGPDIEVVRKARSSGQFASLGYLPPCSGGRGHLYSAVIYAMTDDHQPLARVDVALGTY